MSYKLKCWQITDIRSGRTNQVRAKSRRTLDRQLGSKRVSEVLIKECTKRR